MNDHGSNRQEVRVEAAFRREEEVAMRFAGGVRVLAVIPVALWIWLENPLLEGFYYVGLTSLFAITGLLVMWLVKAGHYQPWMKFALSAADAALLAYILLVPNPLDADPIPPSVQLRFGNFAYAYLLLLFAAFTFSPWLVIWTGACLATAGSIVAYYVATRPGAITWASAGLNNPTLDEFMQIYLHPEFVVLDVFLRDVIVVLVASGMLAAAMWRGRELVRRQARVALERANLARYFSPNVVDALSHRDEAVGDDRQQDVGVLFVDIAGFTHMCETASPTQVMQILRGFHERMETAVFDHHGTLDKYIGDAVMATFGTPTAGPRDATNTVLCALDMIKAIRDWNIERRLRGETEIGVAVGADYGACVVGDVGGATRLEFTVIGDTVNVASRLEELSRNLQADVVISDHMAKAIEAEGHGSVLDGFERSDPIVVRGRRQPIVLWSWRADGT